VLRPDLRSQGRHAGERGMLFHNLGSPDLVLGSGDSQEGSFTPDLKPQGGGIGG